MLNVQERKLTLDEFHAFCELPENRDRLFELIDGEIYEKHVGWITGPSKPDTISGQELFSPTIAVEVKSPTDSKREMRRKAELYLAHGTKMVWLVFPDTQIVEVYMPDRDVIEVGIDGMLDGGDVLPGFTLAVKVLFEEA